MRVIVVERNSIKFLLAAERLQHFAKFVLEKSKPTHVCANSSYIRKVSHFLVPLKIEPLRILKIISNILTWDLTLWVRLEPFKHLKLMAMTVCTYSNLQIAVFPL